MEIKNVKLSNYVGQVKEEDKQSVNDHMVNVDKDLQNLRYEVNKLIRYVRGGSYNDINVGAIALGKSVSAPGSAVISSTTIEVAVFDGAGTTEQLYGNFEILHGYKEGTSLEPHVHWMPTTANVGNVVWQFEYVITNSAWSAISTSTTLAVSSSATGVAWKEIFASFPDISGTGVTIGNQLAFRFFRVPTGVDNYADDAAVLTIGLHYQQDSLGSAKEWSKE